MLQENKDGNTALTNELQKVQRVVDYIIANRGGFTFDRFQKMFVKKVQPKPFMKFWEEHLDQLRKEKRSGTADSYEDALRKFRAYRNNKDILIDEIDKSGSQRVLQLHEAVGPKRERWGIYMRSMRAVYGAVIDEGILSPADDTHAGLKIKKESTVKRVLFKENMMKFVNAALNVGRAHESRNMFVFSYFCLGINSRICAT